MSNVVTAAPNLDDRQEAFALVRNAYGYFSDAGREFCITNPRTPRPWVNVIANPRIGFTVSQTGGGFSWIDNSQLAAITRWEQDLARDSSGKFLYVRDRESGAVWSLSPAPVWMAFDRYACHHGLGYTSFRTRFADIEAAWTLFCHPQELIEFWRVELHNPTDRLRRLELCAYVEWNCGAAPSPRREFHKLFLETEFDTGRRAVFARNHMWEVPSAGYGHWNTEFPYVSALACTEPILSAQGDKAAFLGQYGSPAAPEALRQDSWKPAFGRHEDPIAALRCSVVLRPGQRQELGYALVVGDSSAAVERRVDELVRVEVMQPALEDVRSGWRARLAEPRVETSEPALNYLVNDWLRYQVISGRLWARCGYYQQGGALGFRDQLQDAQVWLTIDPPRCRAQINLHAAHQFADGSVYHWWHPLSGQGHVTKISDDLLWLAFVAANYIKETGDLSILSDPAPFIDDPRPAPLAEHVQRAFERVFQRTSPRGLPYIGAGDWNDGFSAVGLQERGESVWLAQFLAGLLADWAEIYRQLGTEGRRNEGARRAAAVSAVMRDASQRAEEFDHRRAALIAAINAHAWDGGWYVAATRDDGQVLGSRKNRVCRVYLNTQTWAILSDVAPPDRAQQAWRSVRKHLVSEAGPLLLWPAFDRPDERIGYITRYAPGTRENGGVYTHAATWALAAACKMRDHELVGRLLTAINPALKDPECYWAEPYVLPGNVDGPDSPHHGRGGWTWYTGSAQWLHRVVTEWVLGVRPEWDGLRIDPCLPSGWSRASMTRPYRGCTYQIRIERSGKLPVGAGPEVTLDGVRLATNTIAPPTKASGRHEVVARCR